MTNVGFVITHIQGHPDKAVNDICKRFDKDLSKAVELPAVSRMLTEALIAMHDERDTWLDGFWCDKVSHTITKVRKCRDIRDRDTFKEFCKGTYLAPKDYRIRKANLDILTECFRQFDAQSVDKAMACMDICIDDYMPQWGKEHPITMAIHKKISAFRSVISPESMDGVIIGAFFGLPYDVFRAYFIGDIDHTGSRCAWDEEI